MSWPCPSLTVALGTESSELGLGNTVELALMTKAQVNQAPHRLLHLGEWDPYLDWPPQWSWLWKDGCR